MNFFKSSRHPLTNKINEQATTKLKLSIAKENFYQTNVI